MLIPNHLLLTIVLLVAPYCAQAAFPSPQKVAPNVYAFIGETAEPSVENRSAVANQGFIVGDNGVVVIDTGASDEYGEYMLNAIAKISDKPVVLVITTHTAQEHVLGNGAFKRRGIAIVSHQDADKSMAEHCANCLANLKKMVGDDIMANTRVNRPTKLLERSIVLNVVGRTVDVMSMGHAQGPGALVVFDRDSDVLFSGDLLTLDRLPETREAKIDSWLEAITALKKLPIKKIVPGHGPVSAATRMKEVTTYLRELQAKVKKIYDDGVSLAEATKHADMSTYAKWAMYNVLQSRNAFNLYLEIEAKDWAKK